MEGRHNDTTIMLCPDCGWTGELKDCKHGYCHSFTKDIGYDAEPMDYCPKCGSGDIIPEWFLQGGE